MSALGLMGVLLVCAALLGVIVFAAIRGSDGDLRRIRARILEGYAIEGTPTIDIEACVWRERGMPPDTVKKEALTTPLERAAFAARVQEYILAADGMVRAGLLAQSVDEWLCNRGEGLKQFAIPGVYTLTHDGARAVAKLRVRILSNQQAKEKP